MNLRRIKPNTTLCMGLLTSWDDVKDFQANSSRKSGRSAIETVWQNMKRKGIQNMFNTKQSGGGGDNCVRPDQVSAKKISANSSKSLTTFSPAGIH